MKIDQIDDYLIDGWRSAYKWITVQGSSFGLTVLGAYGLFKVQYPELAAALPPTVMLWVAGAAFLVILVGRFVPQGKKEGQCGS